MQASLGFLSPWVDSWRSCEGPTGVREVWGSPAARNRKGGAGTGGGPRARFRHGQGSGSRVRSGSALSFGARRRLGFRWRRG
jgi:hypothetical protein